MAQLPEINAGDLIRFYFRDAGKENTVFRNAAEERQGFSRFTDLLCALLLVLEEAESPFSFKRIGSLFRNTGAAKALEPRGEIVFPEKERLRGIWEKLLRKSAGLPLGKLLNDSRLKPLEKTAFLLAFLVQRNRKYERLFGELQEQEEGSTLPTVGLVSDFGRLFLTDEENDPSLLLRSGSFLNRILLSPVRVPDSISALAVPLRVSSQAYFHALGEDGGLGSLESFADLSRPETADYNVHPELLLELKESRNGAESFQEAGIICLEGESGAGRTFLMKQLAASGEKALLRVSGQGLLDSEVRRPEKAVREIISRCILRDELLFVTDLPSEPADRNLVREILARLYAGLKVFYTGTGRFHEEIFPEGARVRLIQVPFPDMGAQRKLWDLFAGELEIRFAEDVEISHLVSKYNMTPGRIRETLRSARIHAEKKNGKYCVSRQLIEKTIRGSSTKSFGEYASKLDPVFGWDDLQLPEESRNILLKAMDRVRLKSVVNEDYGFSRKLPYGNGVSIVLYGPPGTGKTMTARVLAKELGLDIYRIDLSQVANKYIGESEKTLGKIFDTAKYSNAILFFDEADSLFAKRTEVKDSNDRHANAETAYLLQKIEEYAGVSMLATNVFSNFDEAFRRRMTFLVPIRWPDETERLELWKKTFPPETPLSPDVDLPFYAKEAELTGSAIKAAALSAAFRAAKEKRPVSHQDILEGIADEYRKSGRTPGPEVVKASGGEWPEGRLG